jgi:hypothetical protein
MQPETTRGHSALDWPTWQGVNTYLDTYVRVNQDDAVVIAYTQDSRAPAAWVATALDCRGIRSRLVSMRPLRDSGFPERLRAALPAASELPGRLVVLTFERDTMSHSEAIRTVVSAFDPDRCEVVRAVNAGSELFQLAFLVPPSELSARNTAILERCMGAQRLRVEGPGGTNLRIELDNSRFRWISNRGMWRPGRFAVLPAGEVATFPASISGTLVADFAVNVNTIMTGDARLSDCPVVAEIEQGRLVRYQCPNPQMSEFLATCFARTNARNVGELGFGTNRGVASPIATNSHINERRPGVHIGFGQHNQTDALTGYGCDIHIDLISRGGLLWVDDEPAPLDLENLAPSPRPHPTVHRDEDLSSPDDDLDGDCCGAVPFVRSQELTGGRCAN